MENRIPREGSLVRFFSKIGSDPNYGDHWYDGYFKNNKFWSNDGIGHWTHDEIRDWRYLPAKDESGKLGKEFLNELRDRSTKDRTDRSRQSSTPARVEDWYKTLKPAIDYVYAHPQEFPLPCSGSNVVGLIAETFLADRSRQSSTPASAKLPPLPLVPCFLRVDNGNISYAWAMPSDEMAKVLHDYARAALAATQGDVHD